DAMHELGVALVEGGRPDDALPLLVRATEMRPDDPGYLADEGYARLRTGDVAGAGERIRRASRLDPDDPLTRAYLAELERLEIEAGKPN
ncbi:MAG: tetratricopeptide repeat protein, partial [Chloroflexota bacterium]